MLSLKQIGTLLLCGLLFLRVMVVPVIFLQYQFNKAYIIQNYCINKNRPELHCDGKCYLAKRINAAEQKEKNQAKIQVFKLVVEVFQDTYLDYNFTQIPSIISQLSNYIYNNTYHYNILFSMLKPPQWELV